MCGKWAAAPQLLLYIGRVRCVGSGLQHHSNCYIYKGRVKGVGSGLQHNSNCYVQEGLEVWAVGCSSTVNVIYRMG